MSNFIETSVGKFAIHDFGGEGRDVLLIHGTGHNLATWTPLAKILNRNYHVVAFDIRGHGQTPLNSINPEEYWRDILHVINAMKLNKPILVGHSTGGYAVTAYAASGGECSAITIIDGFVLDHRKTKDEDHGWYIPEDQLWEMFRYGWICEESEMEKYIDEVCASAPKDWLNKGIEIDVLRKITRRSFKQKEIKWEKRPTMEEIRVVSKPNSTNNIYPSVDIYDHIKIPIAFVFASSGLYSTRFEDLRGVAEKEKNRFLIKINSGHNVHLCVPEKVAEAIIRLEELL